MSGPIPIILCGKSEAIAPAVRAGLESESEYEVIHVILTPDAGVSEIHPLLRGETPPSGISNLGTKNYSKMAAAVVTGASYDDAFISEARAACEGGSSVPWLRPDLNTPTPPLGPEYGKAIVARVKVCLKKLSEDGTLKGNGVYYF